jgi:hypothetical protein
LRVAEKAGRVYIGTENVLGFNPIYLRSFEDIQRRKK